MSSEHRENRPFKSPPELESVLEGMRLYVGDSVVEPDTSTAVSTEMFLRSPFVLRLSNDESSLRDALDATLIGLEKSPYSPEDLAMVVLASSTYLKIVETLHVVPLPELAESPVSLPLTALSRPKAMQSPRSGCELEVAMCLSRAREFKPLQAWRRWTWLARIRFRVETEESFGGFIPLPLDSVKRQELGLPAGTTRYVVIDSEVSVASPACSEDAVQLYVDADLLALMSANDRSSNSALLQRILFIDAIWAVVNQAVQMDELRGATPDDIRGSLLEKVIRMATGPGATPDEVAGMLRLLVERPAAFMARIEHAAGLLDGALDVAGGLQ